MSRQIWIADRCRQFGLNVVEIDGWQTRGKESFNPRGVVCHHTAGAAQGELPSLGVLINGRADLPGPLCNVGLGRSGTVYVIAAGRANHAGKGGWKGLAGNSSVLGIEAENDGRQPWPTDQVVAYHRVAAALQSGAQLDASFICAHREWAPRRKPDPHSLDMNTFRAEAARLMGGPAPPPTAAAGPPVAPPSGHVHPTPLVRHVPVGNGLKAEVYHSEAGRWFQQGADPWWEIRDIQEHLIARTIDLGPGGADGLGGTATNAGIRWFQATNQLVVDGVVGQRTWTLLHH